MSGPDTSPWANGPKAADAARPSQDVRQDAAAMLAVDMLKEAGFTDVMILAGQEGAGYGCANPDCTGIKLLLQSRARDSVTALMVKEFLTRNPGVRSALGLLYLRERASASASPDTGSAPH
jgi:hypothetical protein